MRPLINKKESTCNLMISLMSSKLRDLKRGVEWDLGSETVVHKLKLIVYF